MANKPTIAISHLGCEKNRIDSEHMLGLLAQAGYQIDSNEELADYVIVNTCSFIQEIIVNVNPGAHIKLSYFPKVFYF